MLAFPAAPENMRTRAAHEAQSLYTRIKTAITKGEVAPGARLPTERVLATQYGVTRNTVRKTMRCLMAEGLIVRTVGRGTFVADQSAVHVPMPIAEPIFGLSELFEARLLFEPALIDLVLERATEADFQTFDAALVDMRAASTWVGYKEAKYALHLAIARASRNRFMEYMMRQIIAARRHVGWGRADGLPGPLLAQVRQAACRDNAAIIAALRARAPHARELVQDYLMQTLSSVGGA